MTGISWIIPVITYIFRGMDSIKIEVKCDKISDQLVFGSTISQIHDGIESSFIIVSRAINCDADRCRPSTINEIF